MGQIQCLTRNELPRALNGPPRRYGVSAPDSWRPAVMMLPTAAGDPVDDAALRRRWVSPINVVDDESLFRTNTAFNSVKAASVRRIGSSSIFAIGQLGADVGRRNVTTRGPLHRELLEGHIRIARAHPSISVGSGELAFGPPGEDVADAPMRGIAARTAQVAGDRLSPALWIIGQSIHGQSGQKHPVAAGACPSHRDHRPAVANGPSVFLASRASRAGAGKCCWPNSRTPQRNAWCSARAAVPLVPTLSREQSGERAPSRELSVRRFWINERERDTRRGVCI